MQIRALTYTIVLTTALMSLCPAAVQVGPASDEATDLGAEWDASFFPILPWDWMKPLESAAELRAGLASVRACGFTIAGFVRPQDLPVCERLGLAAIVSPDPRLSVPNKPIGSDEELDRRVHDLVDATHGSRAVLGYFIRDEPGALEFAYLAKVVAAVKKHAPGKLAYINLFPGYATLGARDSSQLQTATFAEYLERYVIEVKPQFISYDNYMVEFSMDFKDEAKRRQYFSDLLEVRRVALEHKLPFWNIVSSNQIRPFTTPPSPANLLVQAWTTLAAGGRGVSWFKYSQAGYHYAPLDKEGGRTVTWSYLQMVNGQLRAIGPIMNRLRSAGVYFAESDPKNHRLPGKLVERAETDVPIMIGEFESDGGIDHAILVNLSLERSTKITLHTSGQRRLEVYSPVDGAVSPAGADLWMTAGQGVLLRAAK